MERWESTKWDEEINSQQGCKWTQMPHLWERIKEKNREESKRMIELLTGHGNFRDMLRKKGQTKHRVCRLCKMEDESNRHFWEKCSETEQYRQKQDLADPKKWIDFCELLLNDTRISDILRSTDTD